MSWSHLSSCCTTRPRTAPALTSSRSWRKLWPSASNPSTCPPQKVPSSDPLTFQQRVSIQSHTWYESHGQRGKKNKQTCEQSPSLPHQSLVCLPVCLGMSYSDVHPIIKWMHSATNCKKQNESMQEVPDVLIWTHLRVTCWIRRSYSGIRSIVQCKPVTAI